MEAVNTIATETRDFVAALSIDVLTVIVLVSILVFVGFRSGKSKLINFVLSTYIGAFVFLFFPYTDRITADFGLILGKYDILSLIILGLVMSVVAIVLDYILEFEFSGAKFKNFVNILILAISGTIAILGAAYATGITKVTNVVESPLDSLFTNEQGLFFLILLPLLGVFLVVR